MRELRGKKGKQDQDYCIIVSKEEKYKEPIFSLGYKLQQYHLWDEVDQNLQSH